MRRPLVYLAGPISGLSYGGSTEWRKDVAAHLAHHDIDAISPMRGKGYLNGEERLADSYEHIALSTTKGITSRDRFDVMRSDAILVNLLYAERVSIGTVMEIGWADMLRKPIIIAMEEGGLHWHGMIREAASFAPASGLKAAVDLLVAVLSTGHYE